MVNLLRNKNFILPRW